MSVRIDSKTKAAALLDSVDTILFDCDGVLWLGDQLLPKTKEFLQLLTNQGKKLLFVSNNSAKTPEDYISKIPIPVSPDSIITSSIATALYLKNVVKLNPETDHVHVLGGEGIIHALQAQGYVATREGNDSKVKAVVVGLDLDLSYNKAAVALQYLNNNNNKECCCSCLFIATNGDSTYPKNGTKYPGAGSIVAMMATASGRQPDAVCGKPQQAMMDAIIVSHHLEDTSRCLMVGDRLDTDMAFGARNGMQTLLVETGIDSIHMGDHNDVRFSAPALSTLLDLLNSSV